MTVDLLPGESVLWEGRSARAALWRPADALLTPAGLVWLGLAALWVALTLPAPLAWAGVPFVLAGLWLTFWRFAARLARPAYLLTDVRLIVRGRPRYLRSLPEPVLAEHADGTGSIAFGAFPGVTAVLRTRNPWLSEPGPDPVMWNIPQARHVHALVTTHRKARLNPSI